MAINVRFIGSLRSTSGKPKLTIEVGSSTPLRDVVKRIVERLPNLKRALIDPEFEEPRRDMLVLVNGREISVLRGLETMINGGDEVVFVPVLHGG